MKLSCRSWSGVHLVIGDGMKTQPKALVPGKSDDDASRSSGSRGAARTGTKKASNAHAAQRQSEKASANKANSKRSAQGDDQKSTPRTK
jgi:hypothetical protein